MVKQRREILWMKREIESQTAEISTLRQQTHELKRENGRQRKLIERQKREHSKSVDRVQVLRQLLQQEPESTIERENTLSLEMSITSIAEDTLMDPHDSEAEDGGDSPEQTSSMPGGKREHPVGDSVEEKWSGNVSALMDSGGM